MELIVLLIIAAMSYGLVKLVPAIAVNMLNSAIKNRKEAQAELESSPGYQKEQARLKKMENLIDKTKKMNFVNTKDNKDLFNMRLREEFQFDIERDIVLKGTLNCKDKNNNAVVMPIYLYQPRLFAAQNGQEICIGPVKTKDGKLDNKYMYLAKKSASDKGIYYGYVPKAEISCGSEYDFDKDNIFTSNNELLDYINVSFNRDQNGRITPVNLNNPDEKKALLDYIAKYKDTNIFYEYLRVAENAYEQQKEKEKMEKLKEEAEYEYGRRQREKAENAANRPKKEEGIDKETQAYRDYYEEQYGYYGVKSPYNKYNELQEDRMKENKPPIAPPPPRGPRR